MSLKEFYTTEELKKFNCMGYAFGAELMMNPAPSIYALEWIEETFSDFGIPKDVCDIIAEDCIIDMTDSYKGLEEVSDVNNFPVERELIAFRFALDNIETPTTYNFHFKVRRNGIWSEKLGDEEIQTCELLPDKAWNSRDFKDGIWSQIYYLAWDESLSDEEINKIVSENIHDTIVFSKK